MVGAEHTVFRYFLNSHKSVRIRSLLENSANEVTGVTGGKNTNAKERQHFLQCSVSFIDKEHLCGRI